MSETISSVVSTLDDGKAFSSAEYAGRLTEGEYVRWFKKDSFYNDASHGSITPDGYAALQSSRTEREFEHLSNSEFVLDNFFNLPNIFRKFVSVFAADYSSLPVIESFIHLALLMPSFDTREIKVRSDAAITFYYEDIVLEELSETSREVFNRLVFSFCDSRKNSNPTRAALSMLSILYGTERVMDLMHRWLKDSRPGALTDFVAVVENWEPAFSELPLIWVVNIVRGENVE